MYKVKTKAAQKGSFTAYDIDGNFLSNHDTERIAREAVENAQGGYYTFPEMVTVEVKIIESEIKTPDSVNVNNVNFN